MKNFSGIWIIVKQLNNKLFTQLYLIYLILLLYIIFASYNNVVYDFSSILWHQSTQPFFCLFLYEIHIRMMCTELMFLKLKPIIVNIHTFITDGCTITMNFSKPIVNIVFPDSASLSRIAWSDSMCYCWARYFLKS